MDSARDYYEAHQELERVLNVLRGDGYDIRHTPDLTDPTKVLIRVWPPKWDHQQSRAYNLDKRSVSGIRDMAALILRDAQGGRPTDPESWSPDQARAAVAAWGARQQDTLSSIKDMVRIQALKRERDQAKATAAEWEQKHQALVQQLQEVQAARQEMVAHWNEGTDKIKQEAVAQERRHWEQKLQGREQDYARLLQRCDDMIHEAEERKAHHQNLVDLAVRATAARNEAQAALDEVVGSRNREFLAGVLWTLIGTALTLGSLLWIGLGTGAVDFCSEQPERITTYRPFPGERTYSHSQCSWTLAQDREDPLRAALVCTNPRHDHTR